MLPPLPAWNGLHPIAVHFPIALFTVAPLFVLLAIVFSKHTQWLSRSAFLLLLLGSIGAFIAVDTGEAAAEFVTHGPAVEDVLEEHEEHGERVRTVYVILTLLYGVNVLLLPGRIKKRRPETTARVANAGMLVLLSAANILLAQTGHLGARLVHEFGVHALMPESGEPASDSSDYY